MATVSMFILSYSPILEFLGVEGHWTELVLAKTVPSNVYFMKASLQPVRKIRPFKQVPY